MTPEQLDHVYDNAVYRWNHREFEAEDATFESLLDDELVAFKEQENY